MDDDEDDPRLDLVALGARDLSLAARDGALASVWFRETDAAAAIEQLDRMRSVLLVGTAGVGKTSIVHQIAAMSDETSPIMELSTTTVMSGTRYLGEWETKITRFLDLAARAHAVLYFTDVWNIPFAGKTSNSERNFVDAMMPHLRSGAVRLLAEATPDVLKAIERLPKFADLFHKQAVAPLSAAHVDQVLINAGEELGLAPDAATRRTLVQLTDRFLAARPQPGPAIALLHSADDYLAEKAAIDEPAELDPPFVERVFAIHSGLPLFVVSSVETRRAEDVRAWFRERIVGQQEAIESVIETIALFKAGLCDPERPIGTFLFVGPTGVGKTELARAFATFLFGSPHRLLRFDLSEFKDFHAFEQLIGNPREPNAPARLVDPVRAQPFQVVLLDEIEKAHSNVWDVLLPLLDEGRLTPPTGQTVDFRRAIIIATSNVGAEEAGKSVGFGATGDDALRRSRIRQRLEQSFRPEMLNRFGHIVVFHPLEPAQVRQVARAELKRILAREGIAARNLIVDVDDALIDALVDTGYDARWGARGMKREIAHRVVLPLAMALMEQEIAPGSLIRVRLRNGRAHVAVVDTDASREHAENRAPVKVEPGRKLDREGIKRARGDIGQGIAAIARAVGEDLRLQRREELMKLRDDPLFWRDADVAAKVLAEIDRLSRSLDRLDRLRQRHDSLGDELDAARTKGALELVGRHLVDLEAAITDADREMVRMGEIGAWDALVEIAPIGAPAARDLLVAQYQAWAKHRHYAVELFREPLDDEEPAMLGVRGRFAYGWLRGETGVHRVKDGDAHAIARVRVGPWTDDAPGEIAIDEHRALKRDGVYGGKVRSRLVSGDLVLQNARTLAENQELLAALLGPWRLVGPGTDDPIRRYEPKTPLVHDRAAGVTWTTKDALSPARFDDLLRLRLDRR